MVIEEPQEYPIPLCLQVMVKELGTSIVVMVMEALEAIMTGRILV